MNRRTFIYIIYAYHISFDDKLASNIKLILSHRDTYASRIYNG